MARSNRIPVRSFVFLLLVLMNATEAAEEKEPGAEPLVTIRKGDLPIVLTSPHGGQTDVPNTPPRKGDGTAKFVVLRDTNTAALTEQLADAIEKELGKRPYVVIARFHRKYADANRPPADAYEHDNAKLQYEAFHAGVRSAVDDIRGRWGRGLLLDIHGQVAQPDGIYRGTRDGKTVSALLGRKEAGDPALIGPKSILGALATRDYKILPAIPTAGIGHETRFNGGYIVFAYGSQNSAGLDAIQLEFGTTLRRAPRVPQTAADTAAAVAIFARQYLLNQDEGARGRKRKSEMGNPNDETRNPNGARMPKPPNESGVRH